MPVAISPALTLPANVDAERSLLGGILTANDAYYSCATLTVDDFSLDSHRRIFRAMAAMFAENLRCDLVTLGEQLRTTKELDAIGGMAYLASLTDGVVRRTSLSQYAAIVEEKARLRKICKLAAATEAASADGSATSAEICGRWEDAMMRILDGADVDDDPLVASHLGDAMAAIDAERSAPAGLRGLSYGLAALDEHTGGMMPGEVTVVGARSGVGKSSLMIQAAIANAGAGIPVHLFSLEMSREQIIRRILAVISQCWYFRLRDPRRLSDEDMAKVRAAQEQLATWPLRIHDRSEMNAAQIAMLARLSIRRHGTRLVCVDYAQIAQGEGRDERTRVAGVSRTLTAMIKHEQASLMLLSQLRKTDREGYSQAPHIADLRETGQLENDAHVCVLLHRPWDEDAGRLGDDAQVIVPKQRSGETGTMEVSFDRHYVTFR